MKCDEMMELPWDDPRVAEHGRNCPGCAAWESLWRSQSDELRAPQAPDRLKANVLARLGPEKPSPLAWWIWLWRGLAAGAATCYVLLIVTLGYLVSQPPAPANLAPRLIIYWAGRPESPAPLDGGL